MSRWIRAELLLVAAAASCKPQEPMKPAAAEPSVVMQAPPAPDASARAPAEPGREDAGAPAPPATGAPRTKEYPWMSVASWQKKHEALLARAKQGGIDLLFLGDSITEGWLDNAAWQSHYARRHAANFGIGGDTTENLLWRISNGEIDGLAPKVVVLQIGTNNLGLQGDAPDAVARKIAELVAALRRKLPAAKVLLLGIFPRGALPGTEMRASISKVNDKIALLDDYDSVRFLTIAHRLMNADRSISKEIMPDFLHLSEQGYAIWAEAMEPLLGRMLAK
jgi:lysophospholipase L1-like esterase